MPRPVYASDFPYQPKFVTIGRYRLAYLDEGSGERSILMVHGNPVSGFIYYRLIRLFIPSFRCIVPDLLGFGLSDKPAQEEEYSLLKHIDLLHAFVKKLDLSRVILVGHDWGGPIGFGTAVREKARFTHLVVLNTLTEAPMEIKPVYKLPFYFFLRANRLFLYLVKQKNLFQKAGVAALEPADQAVFFGANHSPETRAGIAAFPRMIPYKKSHPNYSLLQGILEALANWDIPALVLFSDHDSVFSPDQGQRFAGRLKQGRFRLIPGPKHFLQYQAADRVAAEVLKFLDDSNNEF